MCGIHVRPSLLWPTWISFLFSFTTFFRANPRLVLVPFFSPLLLSNILHWGETCQAFFFPTVRLREHWLQMTWFQQAWQEPLFCSKPHTYKNCTPPHPASNTNTAVLTRGCNRLQEGQCCRSESVCCRFTTMKRLSRSKIRRTPNQNCRTFTGFCGLCQRNSNYQYTIQRTAMCICLMWDPVRLSLAATALSL